MVTKSLLRMLVGKYAIYRVLEYSCKTAPRITRKSGFSVDEACDETLERAERQIIREQAWYGGEGSEVFTCTEEGAIVGTCIYWHGARYQKRGFWPLNEDEAKLVQIIVAPEYRGKGIAKLLIQESAYLMQAKGFHRLFARVWHSNTPSLRAFLAAGWNEIALTITFHILNSSFERRLTIRRRV